MLARVLGPLAGLLLALASGPPAAAEDGATLYREACAACHGESGRGDGPAAAALSVPVPDLTTLAARDGGLDPVRLVRLLDGREGLTAHGGPMPMYGGLLTGPAVTVDGPDGRTVETTEPIRAIVAWLGTIQAEETQ